jgi:predicted TIM-barrel fold metal-dependent hydrolase
MAPTQCGVPRLGARPAACPPAKRAIALVAIVAAIIALSEVVAFARLAVAGDYTGPLIDTHSHVPNVTAIDAYVEAMKRHNISKVVLLGVGGVQKNDPAWIAAAAQKYPARVIPGLPLPDPTSQAAANELHAALGKKGARVVGEVHLRQVSRKIERDPGDGAFARVLDVVAKRGVPIVIHDELDDRAAAALEAALGLNRKAIVILAHAGEAPPARIEALLSKNSNLIVDLSGMHFQRKPALASETGPLDPQWKALIEKMPDRFLMGIDIWAIRLFEPKMLDRLMGWTRRILGELKPEVAERVGYRNAAALFHVE